MFKKTQAAILLSCISVSSYAYRINSDLKVINNTSVPMLVEIAVDQKPNPHRDKSVAVLEHSSINVVTDNG